MKLLVYVVVAIGLAGCLPKNVTTREACQVLAVTVYHDGNFAFTDEEIQHLRESNQRKIVALKNWYRKFCHPSTK